MAYVLVLVGLLGAFVWASPDRNSVVGSLGESSRALMTVARSAASPLAAQGTQLLSKIREKAMDLIRKQLHDAVDSRVK